MASKSLLIAGEYLRVAQWTTQWDLLRLAHQTPCSILEAKTLIDFFTRKYRFRKIYLVFKETTGYSFFSDRRMELPMRVLPPWVNFYPEKFLRVGLVLHEFAHFVDDEQGTMDPRHHGRGFVKSLDKLLLQWYNSRKEEY